MAGTGNAGGSVGLLIVLLVAAASDLSVATSISAAGRGLVSVVAGLVSLGLVGLVDLVGDVGNGVGGIVRVGQVGRHPGVLRSVSAVGCHLVGSHVGAVRSRDLGTHGVHHALGGVLAGHLGTGRVVGAAGHDGALAVRIGRGRVVDVGAQGRAGPLKAAGSDGSCVGTGNATGNGIVTAQGSLRRLVGVVTAMAAISGGTLVRTAASGIEAGSATAADGFTADLALDTDTMTEELTVALENKVMSVFEII